MEYKRRDVVKNGTDRKKREMPVKTFFDLYYPKDKIPTAKVPVSNAEGKTNSSRPDVGAFDCHGFPLPKKEKESQKKPSEIAFDCHGFPLPLTDR
ncbi:MAG: hypothetical protein N3E51_03765 [Candidatus Micrarchaeota archaeon]|nr:hypothetical protein [Candidatus Micrarchaeota archaeon]